MPGSWAPRRTTTFRGGAGAGPWAGPWVVVAWVILLAVNGCTGAPSTAKPVVSAPADKPVEPVASALRRAGSATVDRVKAGHYLDALLHLHDDGDTPGVVEIIRHLRAPGTGGKPIADALSDPPRFRFHAIALDIALDGGDDVEIDRLVANLRPVGERQRRIAARLKARAFAQAGHHAAAAATLIPLTEHRSGDITEMADITAAIWRNLSSLPVFDLDRNALTARSPAAKAWWLLARDINAALTGRDQLRLWHQWRADHPRHGAARFPPPALVRIPPDPMKVALFVPLSGPFGSAGEAVRDGFLAAYLYASTGQQHIRIYDTGAISVEAAYEQALGQGADVIVGPLQKPLVATLADLAPDVPVIALNHLEEDPEAGQPKPPNASPEPNPNDGKSPRSREPGPAEGGGGHLVQLSLAVEDQAEAIALALAADGIERVVLFDNPARWSVRARARFEAELEGIEVVGFGTFRTVEDVTAIVGDALHIAASHARAAAIEQLLGTSFEFAPRRRDDVDAIVALVDADELKSLKPALDFHFARDLPVYVPSTAIDGTGLDRLEGVRVCAIPWRLHPSGLAESVRAAFPASHGTYAALFALGVDGFRLANQLRRLTDREAPISGSTGMLTLGEHGRIQRELVWARVTRGRLVPAPRNPGRVRSSVNGAMRANAGDRSQSVYNPGG